MGLFDGLKKAIDDMKSEIPSRATYDLDSLEGIKNITIPKYRPLNGIESPVNNIEYVLQRKATEHKKNGHMDLAIACLRKSNELMDYSNFHYSEKDYIRLVKYLRIDGQNEVADYEERKLYEQHPEFKDKRISNLVRIKEQLKKQQEWKQDLVIINTNSTCNICKKYNRKIYSISGRNKKYPKLPLEITRDGGFCPTCILGINAYFEGINTKK